MQKITEIQNQYAFKSEKEELIFISGLLSAINFNEIKNKSNFYEGSFFRVSTLNKETQQITITKV